MVWWEFQELGKEGVEQPIGGPGPTVHNGVYTMIVLSNKTLGLKKV